ncbi:MAG: glutaredoxin family protein [Sedimenticola sp.]
MKKIIIITLLFAAMLNVGKVVDYFTPLPDIALSDNHEVVMYGTSWCSYCAKARKLFDRLGVAYIEYDIEKSEQARGEYDALGGRGTPLLVINKTLISGYDRKAILAALK